MTLLASTSVTHFVFRLQKERSHLFHCAYTYEALSKSDQGILAAFAPHMQEHIVFQLAGTSTCLKHVVLDIMGGRTRYWTIERVEEEGNTGCPMLKEMSSSAGRDMIRKERLEFNDRSSGIGDVLDF